MFFTFPRRISLPHRYLVENLDNLIELVDRYNDGKNSIYIELYRNNEIDKIFFDFDKSDGLLKVRRLHKYLLEERLKHCVIFSGRGFHVYICSEITKLKNPKSALSNIQHNICEKVGLTFGDPKTCDVDGHIRGNLAQVARLPYTINPKTGLWCCFLDEELINSSIESIQSYASNPQKKVIIFDGKKINHTIFDREETHKLTWNHEINTNTIVDEEFLAPCIKKMLQNPDLRYRERYNVILYLRERSYSISEIYNLMKKYMNPSKFHHMQSEERQVEFLFRTTEYFFRHSEIEEMGYCTDKNCPATKLYKQIGDLK